MLNNLDNILELYKCKATNKTAGVYANRLDMWKIKKVVFRVTSKSPIQLITSNNFNHFFVLSFFKIWTTAKNATVKKI